ncbi:MAG: globin [Actinomycetota bacterium]|nr:globin [Actinomycetota bacterium]MDQ6947855.1 globin [Actinomycetota bacterium]
MTDTADTSKPLEAASTLYGRVGGDAWFETLTASFYAAVAADPVLRPLYPADLDAAAARLCGFLIQYWGGPADYSAQRGHPRLMMRHQPFPIGMAEREAWYRHMAAAVKAGGLTGDDELAMLRHFAATSIQLVNRP